MSKLKSADRKKLPASEFGQPKQRKYPMPDREHAGLAKKKGKLSQAAASRIRSKANRMLGDCK